MSNRFHSRDQDGAWPSLTEPHQHQLSAAGEALERARLDGLERDRQLRERDEINEAKRRQPPAPPAAPKSTRSHGPNGWLVLAAVILDIIAIWIFL